ncbi:MAG: RNA-binding transcriptional accessory protein [Planctomycetaceae bacterium]|nr:RNA-binding transcriptional accessory protein [Planctomycetaceae bacterium]
MNQDFFQLVAAELSIKTSQVEAVAKLLAEEATVPFIARYRKELTGSLDEVAITHVRDRLVQLAELTQRKLTILKSLTDRGLLTDALKAQVDAAQTMTVLEDVYLPYRPKRRTRATVAREKGLEPLSVFLLQQDESADPLKEAEKFIDREKGVEDVEQTLAGARDILAEQFTEDMTARERIRELYFKHGVFVSKVIKDKESDGRKYENYFDWKEPVGSAPSHRVLAMRRGEKEGFLTLRVEVPEEQACAILRTLFVKNSGPCAAHVQAALEDGFKRLLSASMETEVRLETKKRADTEAIRIFAENLQQLLMASPLGQKRVLGVDPGFRTGCKIVLLNEQGKLLGHDVIFPHQSAGQTQKEAEKLKVLCREFKIEAIAIGNGTAGRETETFFRGLGLGSEVAIVMVNESGASVYSASEAAREEFSEEDITVRGAVSIGRRLMDPLAELVKIDPKSIGVGQYQHDVDQGQLKQGLDDTVISCVNKVGVEVNTASKQLLMFVSGLGPQLAQKIVEYRNAHGPFHSRKNLTEVPRLGSRAFEQAAGFLRIRGSENPLDGSAVHPESYGVVESMAADLKCSVSDLMQNDVLRRQIDLKKYVTDTVGLPTLTDIMSELAKPGRDPREKFEVFAFAEGISKIEDLKPGMKLPGIITNITAFGAFVDIGVHQDGLVHISEMSDGFVKDPADVVKVHQKVQVTVLEVDLEKRRIKLSMKGHGPKPAAAAKSQEKKPASPKKGQKAPTEPVKGKVDPNKRLIDQLTLGM